MAICQFYLRGQCKFGSACKNEHPAGFGGSVATNLRSAPLTIPFSQDGIEKDMNAGEEKPLWPLSSYGPAKHEPTIIANLDESPEELRWKAVQALRAGSVADYQKYETEKIQEANQTYAKALSEVAQVFKHASNLSTSAQRGVPHTTGVVYNSTSNTASAAFGKPAPSAFGGSSLFGSTAPTATAAFGGASTTAPAFGQSSFGKPAFGQSAFGQPAFGQSAFGQASKPFSAFGQPSQSTSSAFGQPTQTTSAFGQQPTQPTSAFGGGPQQPSAFGQSSQPQSSVVKPASGAFGTSGTGGGFSAFAGGTNAFGTGAQQSSAPAFGQSAFGGAGSTTSAFGGTGQSTSAPSAFGAPANQTTSAFGSAAKPETAFGQPSEPTNAFGQPSKPVSVFGQAAQPTPAFGQTSQPSAFGQTAPPSAFGQPSQPSQPSVFGQAAPSTSVFGQPQTTPAFGSTGTGADGAFGASAGLPAKPKTGPPDFAAALATTKAQPGRDKHDSMLPQDYAERLPPPAKEAFAASRFEWGKIPEWIPPIEFR